MATTRTTKPLFQLDATQWVDPSEISSIEIDHLYDVGDYGKVVSITTRARRTLKVDFRGNGYPARLEDFIARLNIAREH